MLESAGISARWRVCEPDALPGMGYEDKGLETALIKGTTNAYQVKVRGVARAPPHCGGFPRPQELSFTSARLCCVLSTPRQCCTTLHNSERNAC